MRANLVEDPNPVRLAFSSPGILIVDDDAMLLQLFKLVFQHSGFRVHTATNGRDAVSLFEAHQEEIDLVLLDVCMPILDGPTTLTRLLRINPSILACFISGLSPNYTPQELLDHGAVRLFPKPYPTEDLIKEINSILQSRLVRSK